MGDKKFDHAFSAFLNELWVSNISTTLLDEEHSLGFGDPPFRQRHIEVPDKEAAEQSARLLALEIFREVGVNSKIEICLLAIPALTSGEVFKNEKGSIRYLETEYQGKTVARFDVLFRIKK